MSRANTMSFSEIMIPNRPEKIDGFEYHPVCSVNDAGDVEQCEPEEAEFWSVYAHLDGWGLSCISDHKTEQEAKDFCEFLKKMFDRMPPVKILITVEGGIVQNVFTDHDAEYVVVDYDDKGDEPVLVSNVRAPEIVVPAGEMFFNSLFNRKNLHKSEEIAKIQLKQLNF
jgi:hypothetical protein